MTKESRLLELSSEYRPRVFFVVFTEAELYFWHPILKSGFRHCYVIERLDFIYMMFDPTRYGLNVVLPNCSADVPLIENMMDLDPKIRVLKVVTQGKGESVALKMRPMSCVSVVEYVMGLSFNFCITPYQLFNKLLKNDSPNIISVRELQNV